MAEYTKNYNLEKQQGNDNISIEGLNENFNKIDTALGNSAKFEKASGTGTAIILNGIVLEDGVSKTFIASANNNGVTTTINGKKLYKSGTTAEPSLIAGKAVTVWYSQANDCFYAAVGGDVDTLGGKGPDAFVEKTTILPNGVDLNTVLTTGFYRIFGEALNGPPDARYSQMIVSKGNDTITQIIFPYNDAKMFYRSGTTGNIADKVWKEVSTLGHTHSKSEITDFPTYLPANAIVVPDARSTNNTPEWYISNYSARTVVEFKSSSVVGLSGAMYVGMITVVPYPDATGGYPFQYTVVGGGSLKYRYGTGATTWSSWLTVSNEGHTHGAASITAGQLPAGVTAIGGTDYNAARLRNIQAGTADLTAGSSTLLSGYIYIVYE